MSGVFSTETHMGVSPFFSGRESDGVKRMWMLKPLEGMYHTKNGHEWEGGREGGREALRRDDFVARELCQPLITCCQNKRFV